MWRAALHALREMVTPGLRADRLKGCGENEKKKPDICCRCCMQAVQYTHRICSLQESLDFIHQPLNSRPVKRFVLRTVGSPRQEVPHSYYAHAGACRMSSCERTINNTDGTHTLSIKRIHQHEHEETPTSDHRP